MKRFIAILFLLIYTTTAFGITLDFHYCQGRMVKPVLLNVSEKPDCCCQHDASRSMSKGCCKDVIKVSRTDSHKTVQSTLSPYSSEHEAIIQFLNYLILPDHISLPVAQTNFTKPKRNLEPVYLLCRVFRIWFLLSHFYLLCYSCSISLYLNHSFSNSTGKNSANHSSFNTQYVLQSLYEHHDITSPVTWV